MVVPSHCDEAAPVVIIAFTRPSIFFVFLPKIVSIVTIFSHTTISQVKYHQSTMLDPVTDHLIGAGISLLSLFVKDWLQKVPFVKYLWPRAWEERKKRKRTDVSSDVVGPPQTDIAPLQKGISEVLTLIGGLQSGPREGGKELLNLTKMVQDQQERLCALEAARRRDDQRLSELERAHGLEKAKEDARSARRERDLLRDRVTRAFS
ncbi:hypothetical protein ASPVEDRAFT_33665 [Aspergillus versicolor CBS 583.65]|uniref:Uncharacterized protein n=1 Tax=Aspergillus versicolor CBS 583.65 TaxID=1036611 RepID=A0A1L9Q110_ASPVE|nr:uncharacterized protein ASPVEDRAFT_33665 [Aspergillus versicolor CBS 583.65]OJJ07443.1 hypothetical protein ASPVEDRAFT_33665 [Aspergillus versicolor CBS 583.65]